MTTRSNNRSIYDNSYIIEQLKQDRMVGNYWMYPGYGENQNKCNKDSTCNVRKSDLVDTESSLFNLGQQLSNYSSERVPSQPINFEPKQPAYCNPYLFPPNKKKINDF